MRRVRVVVAMVLASLVCACGASLPQPPPARQLVKLLVVVPFPPPPGRVESIPTQPNPEAVWIDGEWTWRRGRWSWKLGRWVVAPPGAGYATWVMLRANDGVLRFAPGVWRDATGTVIPGPAPLAVANAAAGEIVDAEGDSENTGGNRGARLPGK